MCLPRFLLNFRIRTQIFVPPHTPLLLQLTEKMRLLWLVVLTRLIFCAQVAAENNVNVQGLQYDQLFQTLGETERGLACQCAQTNCIASGIDCQVCIAPVQ